MGSLPVSSVVADEVLELRREGRSDSWGGGSIHVFFLLEVCAVVCDVESDALECEKRMK